MYSVQESLIPLPSTITFPDAFIQFNPVISSLSLTTCFAEKFHLNGYSILSNKHGRPPQVQGRHVHPLNSKFKNLPPPQLSTFYCFFETLFCYLITLKFSRHAASFSTAVGWSSTRNKKCPCYGP